ncbi:PAS domain-containing protein [Tsuneonella amylolytica]|uniref:PAS domain-containing protein n=1 Tax=Tsuneonella amylolytica TaxID=2338327 RepID=UPI000EA9B162|nr:PAS domain-containing protein [Tsuneonella amylolytica]
MTREDTTERPPVAASTAEFCGEDERVQVLAAYGAEALDDDPELTAIARFAAQLCDTPIAFVSLVDRENQRFLAREGAELLGTPRSMSFCAHAMLNGETMVVTDATADSRFVDNELVTGDAHVRFYAGAPLVSPEGAPLGALCVIDREPREEGLTPLQLDGLKVLAQTVMRRLAGRRNELAAGQEANESARRLREIADMLPGIIWSADGDGKFEYFNQRWNEMTGLDRPKEVGDWRPVVHEDDADGVFASWQKSLTGGEPFESEIRLKQSDGNWRWMLSRALPFHDTDGNVARWYGTLVDVDDSHRESEGRDLLARELSHRIKNIFAVVAGLVSMRARKHEGAKEFAEELNSAIRALGRAHDFVRPMEGLKGEGLRGLLIELMAPYADGNGRVEITGDDCRIAPAAATPLALVFHELATNSAKYGGLSAEGGSVAIAIDCGNDDGTADVKWRERGGPAVVETGEEGFGTRLVKMSIEGQLGGKMERRFAAGGMEVDLEIPLASIRA